MTLELSTIDSVFLYVTASAISLFFIVGLVLLVAILLLVSKVKKVVVKAEQAVESVEEATETLKHISSQATGPLAFVKVVKTIIELTNSKKK